MGEMKDRMLRGECGDGLGDDVWLSAGVIVRSGVTIGDHTVVGAGAVVTRDLPAGVVAMGVPARVVRGIGAQDRIEIAA
jgi:maltose O-acetyltransferase